MSELPQKSNTQMSPQDTAAHRLLVEIAQALVRDESSVTVDIVDESGVRTVTITTDADGFGRLVGAQGRTVRAIRTILTALASKSQQAYGLDIRETT